MKVSVPDVKEVISNLDDYNKCGKGHARRRIREDEHRKFK